MRVLSLHKVSRSSLLVLYALNALPPKGSTLSGLRYALGHTTINATRVSAKLAAAEGLVRIQYLPGDFGGMAIVELTEEAREFLNTLMEEVTR